MNCKSVFFQLGMGELSIPWPKGLLCTMHSTSLQSESFEVTQTINNAQLLTTEMTQ